MTIEDVLKELLRNCFLISFIIPVHVGSIVGKVGLFIFNVSGKDLQVEGLIG